MTTSPCTKVCVIDPRAGLCTGCLRTLDEIAAWGGMSDEEQSAVIQRLEERKQASALFFKNKNQKASVS